MPVFNETLYKTVFVILEVFLSISFGAALTILLTSIFLFRHSVQSIDKEFKDNSNGELKIIEHNACKEFYDQSLDIYQKNRERNRNELQERNLEFFRRNIV